MHPTGSVALPSAIAPILAEYAALPQVRAVGLGGSTASSMDDPASDLDVYLFTNQPVPLAIRRDIASAHDDRAEIGNRWWGDDDAWICAGRRVDVMFWAIDWWNDALRRVIERHEPSTGYTTSFWFTTSHLQVVHDDNGWMRSMKTLAASPYPEALRTNIIRHNLPLLRTTAASFRHQIGRALQRDDPVSVNHRVAAFLASWWDALFAACRVLHPGEKRLIGWMHRYEVPHARKLEAVLRDALREAGTMDPHLLDSLDALSNALDRVIAETDPVSTWQRPDDRELW